MLRYFILFISSVLLPWQEATALTLVSAPLHQRWYDFVSEARHVATLEIKSDQLARYPLELLLSSSQYPQLNSVNWEDLQKLYQLSITCHKQSIPSVQVKKAINFELSQCGISKFDSKGYRKPPLIHPAGGSYADRQLALLTDQHGPDSQKVKNFLSLFKHYLTLANPAHPLHKALSIIPAVERDRLLEGAPFYLDVSGDLWLRDDKGISHLSRPAWNAIARQFALQIEPVSTRDRIGLHCAFTQGNLCIKERSSSHRWLWGGVLFAIFILVLRSLWERRRELQERRFILQLLTHELRTPIASLGLTMEQFRNEYDHLNDTAQSAFFRLMADYQRLSRLTETSRGFLGSATQAQFQRQSLYISEWLDSCLDKYGLTYHLEDDKELALPWYWLSVCLDNLLRNALKHGKPPVTVRAWLEGHLFMIEVSDQGRLSPWWALLRPRCSSGGMGVGLFLVKRLMKKMGGRLKIQYHPTRFFLELPL